jgi:hypothetical protein
MALRWMRWVLLILVAPATLVACNQILGLDDPQARPDAGPVQDAAPGGCAFGVSRFGDGCKFAP